MFSSPSETENRPAASGPISSCVPLSIVCSGSEPACAGGAARLEPETCAIVPGASGAPTIGLIGFNRLFVARTGALFAVTDPVMLKVALARFGADARAVTAILLATLLGDHVPEYSPAFGSVS